LRLLHPKTQSFSNNRCITRKRTERKCTTTNSTKTTSMEEINIPVSPIDYRNKVCLAPMVRVCTLPIRRLARAYGADIVYSQELVARKLATCFKRVNTEMGTVDFLTKKNNGAEELVYRRSPNDTNSVLQIGAADGEWALKAANAIFPYFDAIDVNMGCPKGFSVKNGMGVTLLQDRERVKEVLTTLVRNVPRPVTCKIRLLENMSDTIDLIKTIEQTGVQAIGVHARYIPQRSTSKAHLHLLPQLQAAVSVPLIANGDIFKYEDIAKVKEISGCSSVMVARGALRNLSVFSPKDVTRDVVCKQIVRLCKKTKNPFGFTKYTLVRAYQLDSKCPLYKHLLKAKTFDDLLEVYGDTPDVAIDCEL